MGNESSKGWKLGGSSSAGRGHTLGRSVDKQPVMTTYQVTFTEKTLGLKILQDADNKPQVKDIVQGSMAESCGQIAVGDIIVKVNDVTIDTYETFMFIIPTTERPVTLEFTRITQAAAVSRLVPTQKPRHAASSAVPPPPPSSIREKELPGNYLSRDPTSTLGSTSFENELQKV